MLDELIEWGLNKKYPRETWGTQPTNKRIFLESALGGNKSTITEKDLLPEEIQYLQNKWKERVSSAIKTIEPYERGLRERIAADDIQTIKDKKLIPQARQEFERTLNAIDLARQGIYNEDWQRLNKGNFGYFGNQMLISKGFPDQHKAGSKGYLANPNVTYEDYDINHKVARNEDGPRTPDSTMQTTLGKYRYSINRQGKPVITDNYDFNPMTSTLTGAPVTKPMPGGTELAVDNAELGGGAGLYDLVRNWAGRKLPPGKGRPVYINLEP